MSGVGDSYGESCLAAVVEVTNRCNLRCPHCASDSGCARADELSLDEMKRVVDDLASLGCREFTMLGGEFLLRPDWFEIARGVDGFDRCRRLLDDLVADGLREVHAITTFNAKNLGDFDRFAEMFAGTPIVWQAQMAHRGGARFTDDLLMDRGQHAWLVDRVTRCYEQAPRRLQRDGALPDGNADRDAVLRPPARTGADRPRGVRLNFDTLSA